MTPPIVDASRVVAASRPDGVAMAPTPISDTAERGLAESLKRLDGLPSTGRGLLEVDAILASDGRAGVRGYAGHRIRPGMDVGAWGSFTRGGDKEIAGRFRWRW